MSDSIIALVNASPPTNAPRQVHLQLGTMKFANVENVLTRTLHTTPAVQQQVANFTNAFWQHAEIIVIPRAALKHCTLFFHFCVHGSARIPASNAEITNCGSYAISITGGNDTLPTISRFPISFDTHFLSPLIKPAPVQMPQVAISFTTSVVNFDIDVVIESDEPIFDIYVKGVIATGGTQSV